MGHSIIILQYHIWLESSCDEDQNGRLVLSTFWWGGLQLGKTLLRENLGWGRGCTTSSSTGTGVLQYIMYYSIAYSQEYL